MQLHLQHHTTCWVAKQSHCCPYKLPVISDACKSTAHCHTSQACCSHQPGVLGTTSSSNMLAGQYIICRNSSGGQSQSASDESAGASWLRERRQGSSSRGRGGGRADGGRGGRDKARPAWDDKRSSSIRGRGYSSRGGSNSSSGRADAAAAGLGNRWQSDRPAAQKHSDGRDNAADDADVLRVQGETGREGFESPSRGWGYRSGLIRSPDSKPQGRSRSHRKGSTAATAAADAASDFVVIGKSSSGSYMQTISQLEDKEGASFWESAIGADEDEDEDEDTFEDEEGDEGEDDVGVEEVASLMRELARGLEDDESAVTTASAWRNFYISKQAPTLQVGPVHLKDTSTMGRGVFTTAAVAAGDLLMVAAPLALLYCEEGSTPENEELADALSAAVAATQPGSSSSSSSGLALWQQHALLQLRAPGAAAAGQNIGQLPDLLQLLGGPADIPAARLEPLPNIPGSTGDQTQPLPSPPQQQQPLPSALPAAEEVLQLVHGNCTGEEFEDSALVVLRGSTSCGHLGIWPAAAMINHACAPNAHVLLIGDKLVVRAGEPIAAGQQVTLGYLGPQLFAPASIRQQELQQQWRFKCTCARCNAEARYAGSSSNAESLDQLLLQTYNDCQKISEQLDSAIASDDLDMVAAIQQQLQGMQQQVEEGIRAAKPPTNVRRWLQASVYDLYDLLSLCADQAPVRPSKRGKGTSSAAVIETEALATCARIVAAVTPGSSAHADLTTEYMIRSEAKFGDEHQEAVDALRMCAAAHTARFGPVGNGMLQLLMDTRAGAALL